MKGLEVKLGTTLWSLHSMMISRTLQVCMLQSSRHSHLFACRRQDRSLVTNPYRKTLCGKDLM